MKFFIQKIKYEDKKLNILLKLILYYNFYTFNHDMDFNLFDKKDEHILFSNKYYNYSATSKYKPHFEKCYLSSDNTNIKIIHLILIRFIIPF